MDEITLAPEQLARLVEYGEVTVYADGRHVRLLVRGSRTTEDGAH